MGVDLRDLITPKETTLDNLSGKIIAIDAMNAIYQFLAIIRQPDGSPLMDSSGNTTSHLSGLFYRTINFLEKKITPVYVFDGQPPKLKAGTIEERKRVRIESEQKWQYALREGQIAEARKYAQAANYLTSIMKDESKRLLDAMGIPTIQAPSEGEAQAVYLVKRGDAWACASQDYDALLYGTPILVRNLTVRSRRKVTKQEKYSPVSPEIVETPAVLKLLEITQDQLIDLGILVGTDYNEGVPGVGPKTATKLIKKYGSIEAILRETEYRLPKEAPKVEEVREIFKNPPLTSDYSVKQHDINPEEIQELLVETHQFSLSRVESGVQRLKELKVEKKQASLADYFGS